MLWITVLVKFLMNLMHIKLKTSELMYDTTKLVTQQSDCQWLAFTTGCNNTASDKTISAQDPLTPLFSNCQPYHSVFINRGSLHSRHETVDVQTWLIDWLTLWFVWRMGTKLNILHKNVQSKTFWPLLELFCCSWRSIMNCQSQIEIYWLLILLFFLSWDCLEWTVSEF